MRRVAWLIVPILLIGLLGAVVFAARGPGATTAFTLEPGDCFNIPADAQVSDIATIDCAKPHDAEAFLAQDLLAEAPTSGLQQYPGESAISVWVQNNCGATARSAYLGATLRAGLAVGYFFPDAGAWSRGKQRITCYLHASDGSKLTAPLRGAEASASPS
jgi:hypothetical protein